eukprot:COSAG05_NODE_21_length_32397_cov_125.224008_1_plen_2044_part_10
MSPDKLDPTKCSVEGAGISKAAAGISSTVVVYARDKFSNVRTAGGDKFLASLQVEGKTNTLQVNDTKNGQYIVVYNTQKSGEATLSIKVEVNRKSGADCTDQTCVNVGGEKSRSPFKISVSFGPPAAKSFTAAGNGLSSCTAGEAREIVLTAFDAFNNRVEEGGANIQMSVLAASNFKFTAATCKTAADGTKDTTDSAQACSSRNGTYTASKCSNGESGITKQDCTTVSASVDISDSKNGRYTLRFTPTIKGTYALVATINGVQIPSISLSKSSDPNSQRTITVAYAKTDKCIVQQDGKAVGRDGQPKLKNAKAGVPNKFTLQSTDRFGNYRLENSDNIKMLRSDGNSDLQKDLKISYEDKGVYSITWTVTQIPKSSTKWLSIMAGPKGNEIQAWGSPFSPQVLPGGVSPNSVTLSVSAQGLYGAVAGFNATFGITAKDEFGNLLTGNVPGLQVSLRGRNGEGTVTAIVEPNDDGSALQARYIAKKVGVYDRSVTVSGVAITQLRSITTPLVITPGQIAASTCSASGAGLTNARMDTDAEFTITARDKFGNFVTDSIRSKNYECGVAKKNCGTNGDGVIKNLITEPMATKKQRSVDTTIVVRMWGCGASTVSEPTVRNTAGEVMKGRSSVCPANKCNLDKPVVNFTIVPDGSNQGKWGIVANKDLFSKFELQWVVGEPTYDVKYILIAPKPPASANTKVTTPKIRYYCEDKTKSQQKCPDLDGGKKCPSDWTCQATNDQYYRLDISLQRWTPDVTQGHKDSTFLYEELIQGGRRCFYGGTIKGKTPYMYGADIAHKDKLGNGGKEAGAVTLFIQDVNMDYVKIDDKESRVPRTEETKCPDGAKNYTQCQVKNPCTKAEECWKAWNFEVSLVGQESTDPKVHDTAKGVTVTGKSTRCAEKWTDEKNLTAQCTDPSCKTEYAKKNIEPLDNSDKKKPMRCNVEFPTETTAVYVVEFTVAVAGEYKIFAVSTNGVSVDGSSFMQITISAAALSPAHSEVSGAGRSSATAGVSTTLSILGRDRFKNARTTGGSEFAVSATGAEVLQQKFEAGGVPDGECSIKHYCKKDGETTNKDKKACADSGGSYSSATYATKEKCEAAKETWTPGFAYVYTGSYTIGSISTYKVTSKGRTYGKVKLRVKTVASCLNSAGKNVISESATSSKTKCEAAGGDWMDEGKAVGTDGTDGYTVYPAPGQPDSKKTVLPATRQGPAFPEKVQAGARTTLKVELADTYGNLQVTGGAQVSMTACQTAGCTPSLVHNSSMLDGEFDTADNKDGTYSIRYKFKLSKTFTMGITVNNKSASWLDENNETTAKGSTSIDPAPASGSSCKATGSGLNATIPLGAGTETKFTIFAVDEFGNAVRDGDYDWVVILTTIDAETGKVYTCNDCATIKKNGGRRRLQTGQLSYTVSYNTTRAGKVSVAVLLKGRGISGSPFNKTVVPAEIDVSKTTASGPGIKYMIANQVMKFNIEARDTYKNLKAVDGIKFDITIKASQNQNNPPQEVKIGEKQNTIKYDSSTGKYVVSYTALQTGNFDISITTPNKQGTQTGINGNPFKGIICDTTTVASWVKASGSGLSSAVSGASQWFNILAYGTNAKKLVGGDKFEIELVGATLLEKPTLEDSNNGEYRAKYTAFQGPLCTKGGKNIQSSLLSSKVNCEKGGGSWVPNDGKFKIKIFFVTGNEKKEIGGDGGAAKSPFEAKITAGVLSTKSRAEGAGLKAATAGKDSPFAVTCLDWWLNPKTDLTKKGLFTATVKPKSYAARVNGSSFENSQSFQLKAAGKGVYTAAYSVKIAGNYEIALTAPSAKNMAQADDTALALSPWTVKVIPDVSNAGKSICTGSGLQAATAGVRASFSIQAVDLYGNFARDDQKSGFTAKLSTGTSATIETTNASVTAYPFPGTYNGHYQETLAGVLEVSLLLGGSAVPGSPFSLVVVSAVASAAHSDASGPGTGRPAAEDTALFYVQARDKYYNLREGSDEEFSFRMKTEANKGQDYYVCLDGANVDDCRQRDKTDPTRGPLKLDACKNNGLKWDCTPNKGQYVGNYTVAQ